MFSALASVAAIPLIAITVAGLLYALHRESDSRPQRVIAVLVPVWPVLAFCGILAVSTIPLPSDSGALRMLWWICLVAYAPILILASRRTGENDRRMASFSVASISGVALLVLASMVAWGDWK